MAKGDLFDRYRQWTVLGTVLGKLTIVVVGAYVTYVVYQAGLESLAMSMALGGGLYAVVRAVTDWKAGRKPWLPIEREPLDVSSESESVTTGMIVGTALGKVTVLALGGYVTYVVYQAGMVWLATSFAVGGGLYVVVHTVTEWQNGNKPWRPQKRVQHTSD